LSKDLQLMLFRYLATGDTLRIVGQQKPDKHTGGLKYKALDVVRIGHGTAPQTATTVAPAPHKKKKPARILVCNKSSCRKRGSEAVCRAIAQTFEQLNLTEVELKKTGCMDRCKAGPNVVMMPDKAKYTRVSPNQISKLMQQHYSDELAAFQS
ncbi:MAG: (2Fe-2S) ferredoxin domain-containing protein, partial [Cyanobacteria bacterium J06632_22]